MQELQTGTERGVGLNGMKTTKRFMKEMIITDGGQCGVASPKPAVLLCANPPTNICARTRVSVAGQLEEAVHIVAEQGPSWEWQGPHGSCVACYETGSCGVRVPGGRGGWRPGGRKGGVAGVRVCVAGGATLAQTKCTAPAPLQYTTAGVAETP